MPEAPQFAERPHHSQPRFGRMPSRRSNPPHTPAQHARQHPARFLPPHGFPSPPHGSREETDGSLNRGCQAAVHPHSRRRTCINVPVLACVCASELNALKAFERRWRRSCVSSSAASSTVSVKASGPAIWVCKNSAAGAKIQQHSLRTTNPEEDESPCTSARPAAAPPDRPAADAQKWRKRCAGRLDTRFKVLGISGEQ